MSKTWRVVITVICGIVGGWVGYWLGYAAGWSEDADWPWEIGGGTGAILLSMGMAVAFVAIVWALVSLGSARRRT